RGLDHGRCRPRQLEGEDRRRAEHGRRPRELGRALPGCGREGDGPCRQRQRLPGPHHRRAVRRARCDDGERRARHLRERCRRGADVHRPDRSRVGRGRARERDVRRGRRPHGRRSGERLPGGDVHHSRDADGREQRRSVNGRAGSAPGVAVTVAAPGAPRARVRAAGAAIAISLVGVGVRSTAAFAAWSARGPVASATAAAQALPRVAPPTATNTAYGTRVTVSWAAATYPSGSPVPGYVVRVADAATGVPRPVGGGCAGRVETLSCDETGTPDGRWRYT